MTDSKEIPRVSDEFCASIKDFTSDLTTTFPEFASKWVFTSDDDFQTLFEYCLVVYPERFFDILNQNDNIFDTDSEVNVHFLPNVDFKTLYHCEGISDHTRETMWKYLQVVLLNLVNSMKDKVDFGDAMDMFSQLKDGDLHKKLEESMKKIGSFFEKMERPDMDTDTPSAKMPKMEDLHENMQKMFDGKIGKLAKELAEDMGSDLAASFGEDMEGVTSTADVLSKLMKNPEKIGGVVKSVKDKLATKMASGEISREELMEEAKEMMKGMGGLGGMEDMMKGMMGSGGGGMADMMKGMMGSGGGGGMADMMKGMMGGGRGGDMDMFKMMAQGMNQKGAPVDTNKKKTTTVERLKAKAQAKQQVELVQRLEEEATKINKQREYEAYMQANPQVIEDLCNDTDRIEVKISASKKKRMKKKKAKKEVKSNEISQST